MRVPIRQQPLTAPPAAESPAESAVVSLIRADLLIPGRGDPIRDGAVAFKAGKIEWAGPHADLPARLRGTAPTHVPVLMPGLWDCHVHFQGADVAAADGLAAYLPSAATQIGAVTVDDLRRTLRAGYTTVRELGGYANDLWPLVRRGAIPGPNIYASVAALSITGGHGDDHAAPLPTVVEAMDHAGAAIAVCDGADECVRAVRRVVRRGARVIKVCSSGGVLSLNDDPQDRQFSDAELAAIVEEAARSRRAVAAHAIGKGGILAALRAGVRSVEHGMYLDEEVARAMKAQDAVFVGTQHIVRVLERDYADRLPEAVQRKLRETAARSRTSYATAIREGVRVALGTDMISSDGGSALAHGNNAHEVAYAVELGMTPLQAIEAATANGPETLGEMAPLSGQLREGYDADFIAVGSSPLDDIGVLTDTDNITHVWKGGKLFKSPS